MLFVVLTSAWSIAVILAVLVMDVPAVPASTAAVIVSVALPPSASAPTFHRPLAGVYVPEAVPWLTYVIPLAIRSVICNPVAPPGPLFVATIV